MKLGKFIFLLGLGILFNRLANPVWAADPHFFLSPTSGSYSSGFSLDIKVDTGGQSAGGVDVYLEFPKNLLKTESVTKGSAFTDVYSLIKNDEGKLRINAYFPYTEAGKSYNGGDGLVARVNFTPLGTGSAEVKFICTSGSTNESNIVEKATIKDVIVCSANVNGSYTLTAAPSAPTPTSAEAAPTATSTPTLPTPGSPAQTIGLIGLGFLTLLTGLVLVF